MTNLLLVALATAFVISATETFGPPLGRLRGALALFLALGLGWLVDERWWLLGPAAAFGALVAVAAADRLVAPPRSSVRPGRSFLPPLQ